MLDEQMRTIDEAHKRLGIAAETFPIHDIDLPDPLDWPTLTAAPPASVPSAVVLGGLNAETQEHRLARFRQEYSGFPSVAAETARERRVHDGGPREVR